MDEPFNSGPDGSGVQTPDDQHHDAENMYSRIRKRRSNEVCESYLKEDQYDADNMYKRVYKRRSKEFAKSSTTNGTTSMPNAQTTTTKHSNVTNSTVDRLANKKTILDLRKKYDKAIALHEKASAEVERVQRLEKSHREKLEELISKRRLCQNSSNWDSYTRRICETLLLIHANEEDIKKALEIEEFSKDDMETAEAKWKLEATNLTNHSNATNSTEDRLAHKKTIQTLGTKYGETIPLYKKASAEVKKKHLNRKNIQNRSCLNSFSSRLQKKQHSLDEIEKNLQKARKIEESTKEDDSSCSSTCSTPLLSSPATSVSNTPSPAPAPVTVSPSEYDNPPLLYAKAFFADDKSDKNGFIVVPEGLHVVSYDVPDGAFETEWQKKAYEVFLMQLTLMADAKEGALDHDESSPNLD
ncbi:hypothetical protein B9Z55_027588 [Caenorhabditis nigoni]|uniref:Uncharacterized protein n=1 Tax=Caenorhabditis nigoni TaxID=1611254 RepID=A0A2G5SFC8_9PELO|nr:hypothetical protein B9Z55_027588 [Caenorhabditis nigoni]